MFKINLEDKSKSTPEIEQWLEKCNAKINEPWIQKALVMFHHDFVIFGQDYAEKNFKETIARGEGNG